MQKEKIVNIANKTDKLCNICKEINYYILERKKVNLMKQRINFTKLIKIDLNECLINVRELNENKKTNLKHISLKK